MRVLMLAGNFPPEPAIGAARPGAFADYLVRQGHEVRVITTAGPWGEGGVQPSVVVERVRWLRLPVFTMVRSSPPAAAPARTNVPVAPSVRPQHPLKQRLSAVAHNALSIPDPKGGWIPFALSATHRLLKDRPADVIVASGPTFSAHIVAAITAKRFGLPWVADYRDLWSNSTYYPYGRLRRRLDRAIERLTVTSASRVTTVSKTLVEELVRDFSVDARLVRNGYDTITYPELAAREPLSRARANLLYVGNNFYHGRRTPQTLFRAARELGLRAEDIQFHFLGSDPNIVMPIARSEGVEQLVTLHDRVTMAESRLAQASADALILLLWNDPGERGILTGKLFEYAGARRPIVLVGYPEGEAAEIVRGHELGWVVADVGQARCALEQLLATKASSALMPDVSEARRQGLSREAQCETFERLLLECAGHDTARRPTAS